MWMLMRSSSECRAGALDGCVSVGSGLTQSRRGVRHAETQKPTQSRRALRYAETQKSRRMSPAPPAARAIQCATGKLNGWKTRERHNKADSHFTRWMRADQ